MHWDKVSGRLIGQCCTKETGYLESITDRACGGLGTDDSSLLIAKSPGTESLAPLRLQPQPQTVPTKFHPEQGHGIRSFLSFHRDL